jgi:hypothetical protein
MPTQTVFTGTEGEADTFSFARQNGHNFVFGFDPNQDTLVLHGFSPREIRFVQEYAEDGTPMLHFHAGGFAGFAANHTEVTLVGVSAADIRGHLAPGGDALFA